MFKKNLNFIKTEKKNSIFQKYIHIKLSYIKVKLVFIKTKKNAKL